MLSDEIRATAGSTACRLAPRIARPTSRVRSATVLRAGDHRRGCESAAAPRQHVLARRGIECQNASGSALAVSPAARRFLAGSRGVTARVVRTRRRASSQCIPSWRRWPRISARNAVSRSGDLRVCRLDGVSGGSGLARRGVGGRSAPCPQLCRGASSAGNALADRRPQSRAGDVQRQELRLADGARPQHPASPGSRRTRPAPARRRSARQRRCQDRRRVGRQTRDRELCTAICCTTPGGGGSGICPTAGCKRSNGTFAAACATTICPGRWCRRPITSTCARPRHVAWASILQHNALDLVTLAQLAAGCWRNLPPRRNGQAHRRQRWRTLRDAGARSASAKKGPRHQAFLPDSRGRYNQTSSPMRRRSRCEKSGVWLC